AFAFAESAASRIASDATRVEGLDVRPIMTPQFPRIFLWHVVRHLRRHPLLALLNVLSVALGIAVYLAIQIANHSANRSFAAGIDLVAGRAHLEVRGDVDEMLWPMLAKQPGVQ